MAERLIPRERLVAIIERVLPEYGGDQTDNRRSNYFGRGPVIVPQAGRLEAMAADICRGTDWSHEACSRKLRRIRTGKGDFSRQSGDRSKINRRCPGDVKFGTADRILTGLGLTHLWHTELSDLYEDAA